MKPLLPGSITSSTRASNASCFSSRREGRTRRRLPLPRRDFGFQVEAEALGEMSFVLDYQYSAHATLRGSSSVTVVPFPSPSLWAKTWPPGLSDGADNEQSEASAFNACHRTMRYAIKAFEDALQFVRGNSYGRDRALGQGLHGECREPRSLDRDTDTARLNTSLRYRAGWKRQVRSSSGSPATSAEAAPLRDSR